MYDVVAIGELLIDFTPVKCNNVQNPMFEQNPGGAPANVLAMHSKLGGKTAFIGKVGHDKFGYFLKSVIEESNIDSKGLVMAKDVHTTLAFVHLSEQGERSFSFYRKPGADMMLTKEEINKDLIENCKVFHFGSVSLTDEPCKSATIDAVIYAKDNDRIISYDPNYRPALWKDSSVAKEEILKIMPLADIVKISEEEMEFLFDETDVEKCVKFIKNMGASLVLISMGDKGSYYSNEKGSGFIDAFKMNSIDTTGAGDAFLGAILYRLRCKTLKEIKTMKKDELDDILLFANAAGGITTTKKGAIPAMPNEETIRNIIK
ncbi:carbohydrate kinase family protein [Clostridium sediminicola]|uniref:carbohydrate kinase family protein n=1 Tax=Clostridium sediminicola TaxID=3114879 RepID=UPI003D16977B